MKRRVLVLLSVLMLLVACQANPSPATPASTPTSSAAASSAAQTSLKKVNVPLGWLNNDEFVALQVAQAKGFYTDAGLDVNLISGGGSTGFDPIVAINGMDDSIHLGVPAAMSLILKAKAEGVDIIALAALTQYEPGGFIALTKNGVRAKGPCDFKGRIVSIQTEATWYVDALGKQCANNPLSSGKDFTVIPAGWTPDCLTQGKCDFYCGWSTNQTFALEQQGLKPGRDYEFFLASDYLPFYYADVIATTRAYANAHPETVRAFVQASMKGLQYTVDYPGEAVAIGSKVQGVDPAHVAWRIPVQNKLVTNDDTKVHGVGYIDPVKIQRMIDFLAANGQIKATFKAEEVIDNSFLPAK